MACVAGCKRQPVVDVGSGTADSEDDTCGWYAMTSHGENDSNLAALVWFNEGEKRAGPNGDGASNNGATGDIGFINGKRVHLDYQNSSGIVTIDSKPFNVKNGRLFLVNGADGSMRVQQYQCDFSKTPGNIEGVRSFEKSDPHLRQFIQLLRAKAATQPAGD